MSEWTWKKYQRENNQETKEKYGKEKNESAKKGKKLRKSLQGHGSQRMGLQKKGLKETKKGGRKVKERIKLT